MIIYNCPKGQKEERKMKLTKRELSIIGFYETLISRNLMPLYLNKGGRRKAIEISIESHIKWNYSDLLKYVSYNMNKNQAEGK